MWKAPHTPTDAQFFNAQFATYKKTHADINVDYRVTPWASWDPTYTSAFASGSPPDLHYDVGIYFGEVRPGGQDRRSGPEVRARP